MTTEKELVAYNDSLNGIRNLKPDGLADLVGTAKGAAKVTPRAQNAAQPSTSKSPTPSSDKVK